MNTTVYIMQIRKYGKTVKNMTPVEVMWEDATTRKQTAHDWRDGIEPLLKRGLKAEILVMVR